MICVTKRDGTQLYVNAELIQFVEGLPDTVITLTTAVKVLVREDPKTVVASIIAYRRSLLEAMPGKAEVA